MSADIDRRPATRQRVVSPEIQITRQIIGGREVITIDDSDDDNEPVVEVPRQVHRRRRNGDRPGPPPRDGRTRFEEMRRRQQVGEALAHRNRMQAAIDAGDVEFAVLPDDDEDGGEYVPADNRIFSPTPPPVANAPNRRHIGLGGAVLVQDGVRINFNLGERVNRFLAHIPMMTFGDNAELMARAALPAIPAYSPEYTHPSAKQNRFSHSFPAAPVTPDRKGKSVNPPPASINFQCTNCQDNLYLAAPDANRRVYALRCGHLLDGKCVTKLSTPPRGIYPQTENIPVLDVEPPPRKGRARASRPGAKTKPRGKKRKRAEDKITWDWVCPTCQYAHTSEWDASAGEDNKGAWVPHGEDGPILLYL